MDELTRQICATYAAHLALGHEIEERDGARFVRFVRTPMVWDANYIQPFEIADFDQARRLLGLVEDWLEAFSHRRVFADPSTPEVFLALLAAEDYQASPTLQLVLEGELAGERPAPREIRPIQAQSDWESLATLKRVRDVEDCERTGREIWDASVTQQMVEVVRVKAPDVQFFIAREDERDVAYFSSYPGKDGVGMVEDLFTLPEARGRGIARALIHHCVEDARRRGAKAVLIGADPTDTPKNAYVAMGFRPACVTWSWLKTQGDA